MEQVLESLKKAIKGSVVLPDDERYEQLRQSKFNHTAKPAVIVLCNSADDVSAAVNFARDNHLKLSVRSGGHSGAGLSTNDDGMVIDVTPMHGVELLDESRGLVRVGAGATWGEVAEALQPHGLAISSGDTKSVGVGGLSLGGGIGWMVRKRGLSIDNLEAVELVTADGQKLRASADENPDLFWAVRGGGGNFGIATSFEYLAAPCTDIFGGKLVFDAAGRKDILNKWAAYVRTAPEELTTSIMLSPGFGPGATPQVVLDICYAGGDEAAAQQAIQPLRELATPLSDNITRKPYADMLEEVPPPGPMKVRVRNGFVQRITPELIDVLAENFGKPNTPPMQVRGVGGAMSRVPTGAMAFEHRDVEALIVMPSFSPPDASEEQANAQADTLWAPIKPFVHGAYIGFQTDNLPRGINEAYETNRERLVQLKAKYDPQNLFDQNANIPPR